MTQIKPKMQMKMQIWAIAVVLIAGLALGIAILTGGGKIFAGDERGEANHQEAAGHDDAEHHGESTEGHADDDAHADEEHHDAQAEPAKGPHGGRLFSDRRYAVEVTIFETGVEPQFRLFTYLDGKPVDVSQSEVELTLERLGRPPQLFTFEKQADYLKSDAVVEEPHSFKAKLRAVYAGKTYHFSFEQVEARVTMTDAQLREAGIELAEVGPATIRTTISLIGDVKYNGDRTVNLVPRLAGLVEAVPASAGDHVRKGQVLAVLSSQALADQRAELLAAQHRLTLARRTYEREKSLWGQKISPEQDMLQAQAAMQEAEITVASAEQKLATLGGVSRDGDLTVYELRSPIEGVVTDKRVAVGDAVADDAALFTVSDLSSVWVEAPVSERDLGVTSVGQTAVVRARAFGAAAEGRVTYVSALIGAQTRTATARILLDNPKGLWRPGLPVSVEIITEEREVPVAVAADAVQDLRDWKVVFARYGDALEARPLTLGQSDGLHVEVLDGLEAGEPYAAKNSFTVKAELGKAGASHDH